MAIPVRNLVVVLIFGIIIMGGTIWIQIFLSKKPSKRLGLILPMITFMFSMIFVINIMEPVNAHQIWIDVGSTLLLTNIPTIILLVIYFACRER